MILYIVSVQIDREVETRWREWMDSTHIPEVLASGYFLDAGLFRVIDPPSENSRASYQIIYSCRSLDDYRGYVAHAAAALQADHSARFKDRFTATRVLLDGEYEIGSGGTGNKFRKQM